MRSRRLTALVCVLATFLAAHAAILRAEPVAAEKIASARVESDATCERAAAIDAAYFANDIAALEGAPAALEELRRAGDLDRSWTAYLSALSHYRGALIAHNRKNAKSHAQRAIAYLEALSESADPALPAGEVHALLSGAYGAHIASNFLAAIRLGPKSSAAMERARAAAPVNPRVLLLDGVSLFNTPERFGGDKSLSVKRLEDALAAFRTRNAPPCWGEADAHYWLGRIHAISGDASAAKRHLSALERLYPNSPIVQNLSDEVTDMERR